MRVFWLSILAILCIWGQVLAQNGPHRPKMVEATIDYHGHTVTGDLVIIDYTIPFMGMMEIRIFDQDEIVWRNQYVNSSGENSIKLKTAAFKRGKTYKIRLNYKRNSIEDELMIQ